MADGGAQRQQLERRLRRDGGADELKWNALHWIAQARCLAATLDLMPQPVMLVRPGEPIQVWHANAGARRRLASSGVLQLRGDLLVPADNEGVTAIMRSIRRALLLGPNHRQQLRLRARGGTAVLCLQVRALDFGETAELPMSQLVLVELPERAPPDHGLQRLRDAFDLTRKEAECVVGLYAVGSIDEFAHCAGKSIQAARIQLKSAMQKTGTRSQARLVALVASLVNE